MAARIKRDDIVEVISGDHKGARGKVLHVDNDKQRVIVEGVNLVFRHQRRTRTNQQAGRIQKEAPLQLCKVMPVDPKTGRGTRVRFRIERGPSGRVKSKQRVSTAGTVLGDVKRARSAAPGAPAGRSGG